MTERDPFGRLPNDNPLAGLGSRTNGTESLAASERLAAEGSSEEANADRARAAARRTPAAATRASAAVRRRSAVARRLDPSRVADMGRWVVKAVVVVGILVTVAGVAGTLLLKDKVVTSGSPEPRTPMIRARPPLGLDARSLLLRSNLVPVLRRLRASGPGRLRTLRIAPARIDATLLTRDEGLRSVRVRFDGRLTAAGARGAGSGQLPTIPFSRVDADAPSRLARDAASRLRRPVSEVDFVVLSSAGTSASWTVVTHGGARFSGDAGGRISRRIG